MTIKPQTQLPEGVVVRRIPPVPERKPKRSAYGKKQRWPVPSVADPKPGRMKASVWARRALDKAAATR